MAKFRFKLEPLLKARRLAEQGKQRAVAAIDQQRLALEEKLRSQQQLITAGKSSQKHALVGKLDVQGLRLNAAATMQMMREAQRIALELAGVHKRLESARAELVEAAKQRRAVELLREHRFEQWKAEQDRLETQAIDELAVIAAAKSAAEPDLSTAAPSDFDLHS